eukprot:7482985-Lingulodinium_polyedra.AAC.1
MRRGRVRSRFHPCKSLGYVASASRFQSYSLYFGHLGKSQAILSREKQFVERGRLSCPTSERSVFPVSC